MDKFTDNLLDDVHVHIILACARAHTHVYIYVFLVYLEKAVMVQIYAPKQPTTGSSA